MSVNFTIHNISTRLIKVSKSNIYIFIDLLHSCYIRFYKIRKYYMHKQNMLDLYKLSSGLLERSRNGRDHEGGPEGTARYHSGEPYQQKCAESLDARRARYADEETCSL